jgi:ABC-type multidrug transport system permease subunit
MPLCLDSAHVFARFHAVSSSYEYIIITIIVFIVLLIVIAYWEPDVKREKLHKGRHKRQVIVRKSWTGFLRRVAPHWVQASR